MDKNNEADIDSAVRKQRNFVRDLFEGRTRSRENGVESRRAVFKMFVGGHGGDFNSERQAIRDILPELCR